MRIVVTHINPDLDAVFSVWLIKRFLPGWEKAEVEFVPAGQTYKGKPPDSDPDVLHCDTGGGKFDHHQTKDFVCAAILVWQEVLSQNPKIKKGQKEAIKRMLKIVNEVDHARFLAWPEPISDRWDFCFHQALGGMIGNFNDKPEKIMELSLLVIDGIFRIFFEKVEAEEILKNGLEFKTKWGKGIAIETENAEVAYLALKLGYALVVKKRPKAGHLGLYGNWQNRVNLYRVYQILKRKDPQADWFYHKSGCMVLNGSMSNPKMKATKLGLGEVIEILKIYNKKCGIKNNKTFEF